MELIHLLNRAFHTNIFNNAAETLQFEDLALLIITFKKTCACSKEKYKIGTFDQWWWLIIKYFYKEAYSVTKEKKCPFLHTVQLFVKIVIIIIKWNLSKMLNKIIWILSLEHANIFLKIIILDSKVFKLQRFSNVTQNGSLKHPFKKVKF